MADIADLGFRVDTSDLRRAQGELQTTARQGRQAERDLTQSADRSSKSFGDLAGAIKLAGGALAAFGAAQQFNAVVRETDQLQRNMLRTEQLIQSTGRTASTSARELRQQARELALATLGSTEGIMEAQQLLLGLQNVGTDTFGSILELASDYASVIGGDVVSATRLLGRAFDDPANGAQALGRILTREQRESVAAIAETNGAVAAQTRLIELLSDKIGGTARAEALGLAGAQDTLGQAIQEARIAIGQQSGVIDLMADSTNKLAETIFGLTAAYQAGDFDTQLEILKFTAVAAGAAGGAYMVYRGAVAAATIAQLSFNVAARANPVGLAVTAIGLGAAAVLKLRDALRESQPDLERARDIIRQISSDSAEWQRIENQRLISIEERRLAAVEAAMEESYEIQMLKRNLERLQQAEEAGDERRAAIARRRVERYAEFSQQLENLQEQAQRSRERLAELRGEQDDNTDASEAATDALENQANAAQAVIDRLVEQARTLNMSSAELAAYNVLMAEGTAEQAAFASELVRNIDAINASADAAREHEQALEAAAAEQADWLEGVKDSIDPLRRLAREAERTWAALAAGELSADEARAYIDTLTSGFKTAADEAEYQFDQMANRVAGTLQNAIASGNWQGVGRSIGGILAGEIGGMVAQSISTSLASAGAMAGPLGALGGAVVGGLLGGIMGGRSRTVTRQIELSIENMVAGAFEHVRIKSSGAFGSSTRRYVRSLGETTEGIIERSFEQVADQIGLQASGMGIAAQSLEDFAFTIRREGLTLSEFTQEAAEAYVSASFAAITDYQYAHENIMQTWTRMANDARDIGQAFMRTTGGTIESRYADQLNKTTDAITEAQRKRRDADQEQLNFLQSASLQQLAGLGMAHLGQAYDNRPARYTQTRSERNQFNDAVSELEKNIEDAKDRIAQAYEQAGIEFNAAITGTLSSLIEGLSPEDAGALFAQTTDAWIEATKGADALALAYQEQAERGVNQMFERLGVSMQYSAGQSLADFEDYFAQHIEQAISAATPEEMAAAAGKAEAEIVAMKDALLQAEEATRRYTETLNTALTDSLSDLRRAVGKEIQGVNDSYNSQIKAIRDTAQAESELARQRISDARQSVQSLRSLRSMLSGGIRALQDPDGAQGRFTAAQDQIAQALAQARQGNLPTAEALEAAMAGVGEFDRQMFDSAEDAAFQAAVTANQLKELDAIAGRQLSIEERTLEHLQESDDRARIDRENQITALERQRDAQVAAAQRQYDQMEAQVNALLGIDTSVKSVEEAIKALQAAIDSSSAAGGSSSVGGASGGSSAPNAPTSPPASKYDFGGSLTGSELRQNVKQWADEHPDLDWFRSTSTVSRIAGKNASIRFFTQSDSAIREALQAIASNASAYSENLVVPAFSSGGYTGNMATDEVAGLVHGQEFVLNAAATRSIGVSTLQAMNQGQSPSAIYGDGGSMVGRMVAAAVEGLRSEMRSALGSIAANTYQSATILDNATRGGALATVVEQ